MLSKIEVRFLKKLRISYGVSECVSCSSMRLFSKVVIKSTMTLTC